MQHHNIHPLCSLQNAVMFSLKTYTTIEWAFNHQLLFLWFLVTNTQRNLPQILSSLEPCGWHDGVVVRKSASQWRFWFQISTQALLCWACLQGFPQDTLASSIIPKMCMFSELTHLAHRFNANVKDCLHIPREDELSFSLPTTWQAVKKMNGCLVLYLVLPSN